MRVVVGSESWYKIRLVKHVLTKLDLDPEVVGCKAWSGVSEQPMQYWETMQWAIHRAHHALQLDPDADVWCGIEFGYEPVAEELYCVVYVCLVVTTGESWLGWSSSFKLPKVRKSWLQQGREVRDMFLERDATRENDSVSLQVFQYMRKDDQIIQALISAWTSYLSDKKIP